MARAHQIRRRRLGRTGLEVSELGFGAWGIGGGIWQGGDDAAARAAIRRAVRLGINFFDTAALYGDGHSETLLGEEIGARPDVLIATKVAPKGGWPAEAKPLAELFPGDHIVACTEASLRRLRRETIDVQQLHLWWDEWADDPDWQGAAARLKRAGKIRAFGISARAHAPDSVLKALATGLVDTVQVIYNVFEREPEVRLFPECQVRDIGVIARVPFDEGSLAGVVTPDTRFVEGEFRARYFAGDRKHESWEHAQQFAADMAHFDLSLPESALRFCLSHPAVSTVIPGMRRPAHVEGNAAAAARGPLPAEVLSVAHRHAWRHNFHRPYEKI